MDFNVEVARRTPCHRLACAGQADHLSTVYSGRDHDVYLLLFFIDAFAAAGVALFFRYLAGAVADLAGLELGPRSGTRALAGLALCGFGQKYRALGAKDRLLKANFKVNRDVAAAAHSGASLACKKVAKDVAKVKAKPVLECVLKLGEVEVAVKTALSRTCSAAKHAAVRVVLGPLFVVAQD